MAQTPEGKVKQWLRNKMKEWYPTSWHYSPPGGPFGRIGIHDDEWLIKAGMFCVYVAIESKADDGVPTEPQKRNLFHVKDCGGIAAVLTGKDVAMLFRIKAKIDERVKQLESYTEQLKGKNAGTI